MTNKLIEVGFKKQVQPVRIAGLDFEIKTGKKYRDQYLAALPKMLEGIQEQEKAINEASKSGDYGAIVEANKKVELVVKNVIDLVLGEGAFEKLMYAADEDIDFATAFVFFYIAVYGISITENLGQLGVPIPNWVKERLSKLQDTNTNPNVKSKSSEKDYGDGQEFTEKK